MTNIRSNFDNHKEILGKELEEHKLLKDFYYLDNFDKQTLEQSQMDLKKVEHYFKTHHTDLALSFITRMKQLTRELQEDFLHIDLFDLEKRKVERKLRLELAHQLHDLSKQLSIENRHLIQLKRALNYAKKNQDQERIVLLNKLIPAVLEKKHLIDDEIVIVRKLELKEMDMNVLRQKAQRRKSQVDRLLKCINEVLLELEFMITHRKHDYNYPYETKSAYLKELGDLFKAIDVALDKDVRLQSRRNSLDANLIMLTHQLERSIRH